MPFAWDEVRLIRHPDELLPEQPLALLLHALHNKYYYYQMIKSHHLSTFARHSLHLLPLHPSNPDLLPSTPQSLSLNILISRSCRVESFSSSLNH